MNKNEQIKQMVKQKYSEIALQEPVANAASCCGSTCCSSESYQIMSENYEQIEGYHPEADLKLGCGLPTEFAKIKKGDTVIDLGSGAGNDCFVARHETGSEGKVIGIDFSTAMIERAKSNALARGYDNVEFIQGDIENIPVDENVADVVVSNCVMNLVPDKIKAFSEIYRILKPGGHFSISDIVLSAELPSQLKEAAEMYAGCVAGAVQKQQYLEIIKNSNFKHVVIQKERPIVIPDDILAEYLNEKEFSVYKSAGHLIYSITVYAEK